MQLLAFVKKIYWNLRARLRQCLSDSIVDTVKICSVRDVKIKIRQSNDLESYRISSYSTKEPETLDWIEKHLSKNDVLYDVGANIGLYSIYAAMVQPTAAIYAFEPVCANMVRLQKNIALNNLNNVTVMNLALTDKSKIGFMKLSSDVASSALHSFATQSKGYSGTTQGSIGISLDELVYVWGLPKPNHLKIDVDGNEDEIITGAQRLLKDENLKSILIESSENLSKTHSELLIKIESFGFKIAARSAWVIRTGNVEYRNYILTRSMS